MLTQSTQLGCSCAWALASTQTHKLVQSICPRRSHTSTMMRARGCAPSNSASALRIWWFSHIWTFSWENCPFSSKWNRLWSIKASFAIKGLMLTKARPTMSYILLVIVDVANSVHDTVKYCSWRLLLVMHVWHAYLYIIIHIVLV